MILIALKANDSHVLQSLDVALLRTLKSAWQRILLIFAGTRIY